VSDAGAERPVGTERAADDGDQTVRTERIHSALRTVRTGHGGNCSSIGSVIDTLFASAVVGGALFAAIAAALACEGVTEVRRPRAPLDRKPDPEGAAEGDDP
jgi:hypothetical protein